jgi:formylmethanofuran dehydrogenase subunit E
MLQNDTDIKSVSRIKRVKSMTYIPDNYDAWKARDTEQAKAEANAIHCDICEEAIYEGEDYIDLHGDIICDRCIVTLTKTA